MDRIDAMRAYVQVVESASFTRAAQALVRHKATVSQQVLQLEAHLGVRLLERTTRVVKPTTEGTVFYRQALRVLQQLDEAEGVMRAGRSAASGLLRVEVSVAIGRLVLVPAIRGFLDRYPRIRLEFGCTDRKADLVKEGIDCAVRGGHLPDSSLVSRAVGRVAFGLFASPNYVERHGLPASPDDLATHQRAGYMPAERGQLPEIELTRGSRTVKVAMPARFVTTDSGALLSAGLDGVGIVLVSQYVAAAAQANGSLVRVLPDWHGGLMPLHVVTPTARLRTARVQAFLDFALTTLRDRLGPHLLPMAPDVRAHADAT